MTPSEGPQPKTEQASQAPQVAKQGASPAGDRWKKPFANAFKLAGTPRQATGSTRQIVDAALLGMCIVFFVVLLGQKQLDSSLTGAAIALPSPLHCW